ncbi:MAG: Deoxyguanosinetriphosphate triphosphohydrolase [Sodalis sp.]|nr:MAG: Deoxyguanosinetriphosphate triphosphohydrolase [Sodalis sp.]
MLLSIDLRVTAVASSISLQYAGYSKPRFPLERNAAVRSRLTRSLEV